MSKFAKFMKSNKTVKENEMHPVTNTLCDDEGNPLNGNFVISVQRKMKASGKAAPLMFR